MYSSLPQPDTSPLSSQPPPTASSYLPLQPISTSSHSSGQVAVTTDLSNDSAATQLHGQQVAASSTSHASNVYCTVTTPYDYTKGYHYLMQYLRLHFDQNDILRVVRALAIYRPSLIALQVPLSIEDETFAEKSLQRSLIELEKLISYSGTPTVVWRRTGEICLVGLEFSMLTEWSQQELQNKFIYELFERQSVVEYWEAFARHSFESHTQSVYSHCVLLKPSGEPVPCSFCFTIRRDIFDCPSLIIGQWLPLLG